MPQKGLFISFEGGEGAGKTTQIRTLQSWLTSLGYDVIITREPGGTPEAETIRNLFVNKEGGNWSPEAEVLLLFAGRAMHLRDLILPALAAGKIVLCDRFTDSTRVYQCSGRGLDRASVEQVKQFSIGAIEPDLTFVFDLPVSMGLGRAKSRISANNSGPKEDRFEQIETTFHEKLRAGYLALAKEDPERFCVLDASQPIAAVTAALQGAVKAFLDAKSEGSSNV